MSVSDSRYELPRDEERFQAFLMRVPAVKYKIFQVSNSVQVLIPREYRQSIRMTY